MAQRDPSSTPTDTGANSPTPMGSTESAETRTSAEKIMLAFGNESSADVAVHFSIMSEGTVVSEGEVQVSQGEHETVETEIDTTGQYELRIEGDSGFESTYPVQIEEYDLRMGSNLIVEIYDGDTELLIEE
ncbi:hypothetical protein [Halorarum salinum]|uniref:hypothetical protein n=1 Tax=Halorarum salinum TaxID=2743089 RepID=UPI001C52797E|nr:hypothetical protein [Halobaculum salinum]